VEVDVMAAFFFATVAGRSRVCGFEKTSWSFENLIAQMTVQGPALSHLLNKTLRSD
jgi:hypothetical protein